MRSFAWRVRTARSSRKHDALAKSRCDLPREQAPANNGESCRYRQKPRQRRCGKRDHSPAPEERGSPALFPSNPIPGDRFERAGRFASNVRLKHGLMALRKLINAHPGRVHLAHRCQRRLARQCRNRACAQRSPTEAANASAALQRMGANFFKTI